MARRRRRDLARVTTGISGYRWHCHTCRAYPDVRYTTKRAAQDRVDLHNLRYHGIGVGS